jgi:hypothetical protein
MKLKLTLSKLEQSQQEGTALSQEFERLREELVVMTDRLAVSDKAELTVNSELQLLTAEHDALMVSVARDGEALSKVLLPLI